MKLFSGRRWTKGMFGGERSKMEQNEVNSPIGEEQNERNICLLI